MASFIETTGGKKYKIPTNKKKELKDSIFEVQKTMSSNFPSSAGNSVADELSKLHGLMEKGVISQEEFDKEKKKILG